ncbi:MAG: hypothetical protein MZU84_06780 [Sphingobacterium sp.]|nr:hypothetical protein [Sphingobacterium sp.]
MKERWMSSHHLDKQLIDVQDGGDLLADLCQDAKPGVLGRFCAFILHAELFSVDPDRSAEVSGQLLSHYMSDGYWIQYGFSLARLPGALSKWTVKTLPTMGEFFVPIGYHHKQEITVKKFLKIIGILVGIGILAVIVMFALLPWMDKWGATDDEITASFSGDELVPSPRLLYTRAVTVTAAPEQIYPWIVQLGADKGGMYSYTWLETLIQCPQSNADRIHEEWQDLKVGDKVLMCKSDMPPGYEVAIIEPNRTIAHGAQAKQSCGSDKRHMD